MPPSQKDTTVLIIRKGVTSHESECHPTLLDIFSACSLLWIDTPHSVKLEPRFDPLPSFGLHLGG